MRTKSLMREALLIESEIDLLVVQSGLSEMLKEEVVVRAVLAEERKVIRYAVQQGIVKREDVVLNEGLLADVVLGLGQTFGSGLHYIGVPVGAAFGAAGVLWYGKEMLEGTPGTFQFFMDLIFCLFSAAATVEPTGTAAATSNTAKLVLSPFAKLGLAAKELGKGVVNAASALKWTKTLTPAAQATVKAAGEAAPAIEGGLSLTGKIVSRAAEIMPRVINFVKNLPGAKMVTPIIETVTKYATQAWQFIKECIQAVVNVGKTALGKTAAAEAGAAAKAADATTAAAIARVGDLTGARLAAVRQSSVGINRLLGTKAAGPLKTYMTSKGINAAELLGRIAAGDAQAIKAINAATNTTKLPRYIQSGVDAYKGASVGLGQASAEASRAIGAQQAAYQAAQQASQTAAARTAAASAGAKRVGASGVKAIGSTPEEEYAI